MFNDIKPYCGFCSYWEFYLLNYRFKTNIGICHKHTKPKKVEVGFQIPLVLDLNFVPDYWSCPDFNGTPDSFRNLIPNWDKRLDSTMLEKEQKLILELRNILINHQATKEYKCVPGCSNCCGTPPWTFWEIKQLPKDKQELWSNKYYPVCPYITFRGCSVYEYRPITCRVFGLSDEISPCSFLKGKGTKLTIQEYGNIVNPYDELLRKEMEL